MKPNQFESIPLEMTELSQEGDLPVLYINCKLQDKLNRATQEAYLDKIRSVFNERLPNHHIIVGNQDLGFAYISSKEAFYQELKQDHRQHPSDK